MKYFFSKGRKLLDSSADETLFAFDFDGTLAPLTKSPELTKLSDKTRDLIHEISVYAHVAIISGRRVSDLHKFFSSKKAYLIGNHGLEDSFFEIRKRAKLEGICAEWIQQLNKGLAFNDDFFVEDKTLSLSVHFRMARNKQKLLNKLWHQIENLNPSPRVILGKSVVNLVPDGVPHKGDALKALMKRLKVRRALYVGDDVTDEDVFLLRDKRIMTVRVGKKLTSEADYYIRRQGEINRMLLHILKSLMPKSQSVSDNRN